MGTLYLVRHGQASFGADDYDRLSDLGVRQSVRLGEYFAGKGIHFGGPIATAVGHVLGTSAGTTIEPNLRIRNSSVTEFAFTPKRHMLVSYNALLHLAAPDFAHWVSYA